MTKPKLYRCSCGAQGTYEYIMEHSREKDHKLDPCEMGEHQYEVVKTYASSSGEVLKLRCKNCGFKKKITKA